MSDGLVGGFERGGLAHQLVDEAQELLVLLPVLFLGLLLGGDVGERRLADLTAWGLVGEHGVQVYPERRPAWPQQAQLAVLWPARAAERLSMQIVDILVIGVDEACQRPTDQLRPVYAEPCGGREVGLLDPAVGIEREVAYRGKVVEVGESSARGFQALAGPLQLVVLHLEFDLVDFQLVQQGVDRLGIGQAATGGRAPA